jgi:hypothetical protein
VARPTGNGLGWGQDFKFARLLVDGAKPDGAGFHSGVQAGSAVVGVSSSRSKSVTVTFPTAFKAGTPVRMLAQVRLHTSGGEKDDTYLANVLTTTATSATIEVNQIWSSSTTSGWDASSDLHVDWMAWSAGMCADSKSMTDARGLGGNQQDISCAEGSASSTVLTNGKTWQGWVPLTGSSDSSYACTQHSHAIGIMNGAASGGMAFSMFGFNCTHVGINVIHTAPASNTSAPVSVNFDWLMMDSVTVEFSVLNDPAYIQAQHNHKPPQPVASVPTLTAHIGPLVQEVWQEWRDGYAQAWRLYTGGSTNDDAMDYETQMVEVVTEVGPLDKQRELSTRFSVGDMDTAGLWYTDDNGLETIRRRRNNTEPGPVSANYYPTAQFAYIQDAGPVPDNKLIQVGINDSAAGQQLRLTLLNDRAHGAASIRDSELELMLHRRCKGDDHKVRVELGFVVMHFLMRRYASSTHQFDLSCRLCFPLSF